MAGEEMTRNEKKVIKEARDWLMGAVTSSDKHCIARLLTELLGKKELSKFDKNTLKAISGEKHET